MWKDIKNDVATIAAYSLLFLLPVFCWNGLTLEFLISNSLSEFLFTLAYPPQFICLLSNPQLIHRLFWPFFSFCLGLFFCHIIICAICNISRYKIYINSIQFSVLVHVHQHPVNVPHVHVCMTSITVNWRYDVPLMKK